MMQSVTCSGHSLNTMLQHTAIENQDQDMIYCTPIKEECPTKYADMTDKQKKYTQDWKAKNVKQVKIDLNRNTDEDIIKYLDSMDNKQGYLKDLIRKDMKRQQN